MTTSRVPLPVARAKRSIKNAYAERKLNEEYISTLIPDHEITTQEPSVAIFPRAFQDTTRKELSEEDLVIMSHRVFGFILRSRKWGKCELIYMFV